MNKSSLLYIGLRFMFGKSNSSSNKDLARKAIRGALLSVSISLIPLIIVMQVSSGMIQGITDRYIELGSYHMQLRPISASTVNRTIETLNSIESVRAAWPELRSAGVVFSGGKQEGVAIRAIDPGFLEDAQTLRYLELRSGSLVLNRPVDALIGSALATKLGLSVGDAINVITLRNLGGTTQPRISIFIIQGIISAGYRELDAHWLMIPYQSAARIIDASSSDSFIGIKVHEPYAQLDGIRNQVLSGLSPGVRLYTWNELERSLIASLANTQIMLLFIMAITVIVAAVNIASALSTLALERVQEIAILKCIGAQSNDIKLLFALSGAILGGVGGLLGSAGGILLSQHVNAIISTIEHVINAIRTLFDRSTHLGQTSLVKLLEPSYYLEKIPITIEFSDIASILFTTIVVSFLAAFIPAKKAASLVPLEIFRKHC